MDLAAILEDQNPWWREPSPRAARRYPMRRDLQKEVLRRVLDVDDRRALVILGPRQVGKTVILMQTADDLLDRGLPAHNLTYFDFSDDRVTRPVTAREIAETRPAGQGDDQPRVLLLDEVRLAPNWARWLKQAVDRGNDRIVVTDSAASLLRDAGRESGQGRWDEYRLEGLSFREFLKLHGRPDESAEVVLRGKPNVLERYLDLGGFPEHALSDDPPAVRRRLRGDIVDRAILRDLSGRVDSAEAVRDLFVYLMQGSGGLFNARARATELAKDERSVRRWERLLEDTFLVSRLPRFARSPAVGLRSQPKLYAADHGLVSAFAVSRRQDSMLRGQLFEAAVFRHLREAARESGAQLYYFRTKAKEEIDFVVEGSSEQVAVEVTCSRPDARKRRRLQAAGERLKADRILLVHGGLVAASDGQLSTLPLQRFLLDPLGSLKGKGDEDAHPAG